MYTKNYSVSDVPKSVYGILVVITILYTCKCKNWPREEPQYQDGNDEASEINVNGDLTNS